jgi:hypothetical protein
MRHRSPNFAGGPGKVVTAVLLPAQAARLQEHADARGISKSALMRHVLREFLRQAGDR